MSRDKMKKYKVQVGFLDEDYVMHSLGVMVVEAETAKEAKGKAIDKLYDFRLDSASCSPWTRIIRGDK
jgi:hypothetical protein